MPPIEERYNEPLGERVAKLEQRISSHEEHCDERHQENQDRLAALEDSIASVRKMIISIVFGVGASVIVGLASLLVMILREVGHL